MKSGATLRALCLAVRLAPIALLVAWAIGQGSRDATWLTGLCFYVPSPVVAAALLAAAGWRLYRRARKEAVALFFLAFAPAYWVAQVENHWRAPPVSAASPAPGPSRRLVHWNVMAGTLGWERVAALLLSLQADAIAISEAPPRADLDALAAGLGEGFRAARFRNLAFVARGAFTLDGWRARDELRVQRITWDPGVGPLKVLVVDLKSSVLIARAPLLERLKAICEEEEPDLVVGDFNAPRRSLGLDPPPAGLRHAYDLAGAGWSYSWPMPLPVYAIDQCLVGPRIRPLRYELVSTSRSDHRMQRMEFVRG